MKGMKVNAGMWLVAFLCLAMQSFAQTQTITVDVAGTLEEKLGDNKATTEELIVSGSLNGADIKCIRQMLKLRVLNIKEASIVSGGGAYYIQNKTSENTIGQQMFYNMNRLTSVVLPKDVTFIDSEAFGNCVNLETIKLPEKLKGLSSGGDGAIFRNCIKLTSIEIPEGVSDIPYNFLRGCSSLESVTIPSSVTEISAQAFYNCSSLKKISLPKVKIIKNNAFGKCASLSEITFSSELSSIESSAFYECTSLSNIILPDGINEISSSTFQGCTNLTSVTLPSELAVIGSYAFQECKSLKSIEIPQNVGVINEYAFYGCTELASVTLPAGLGILGNEAFSQCSKLTTISIPENVVEIQSGTFSSCTSLTSISLPLELQTIGSGAFSGCSQLASISLPERLINIGSGAFSNCSSLKSIELPNTLLTIGGFSNSRLQSIVIPQSVTTIEGSAFSGCKLLTSITLPEGLKIIGNNAFKECESLSQITIPSTVDSLGKAAFQQSGLTEITIPEKITTIYDYTFSECSKLKTVQLPPSLKILGVNIGSVNYAGAGVFYNCILLESIKFSKQLTIINEFCFYNCPKLTSISLPDKVTTIGQQAFKECTSIKNIQIPASVTTIEKAAFHCSNAHNYEYIVWNSSLPIQSTYFREYDWDNYKINYLYLPTSGQLGEGVISQVDYVIRDGIVDALDCTSETATSSESMTGSALPINAPIPFKTKKITFHDYYAMRSGNGSIGGWQTIVLPFTPQKIEHESKGTITPFGSDVADAKHFWLYEVTADGFTKATKIEANKPYIISMPNNDAYPEASNLKGKVTFTAEDAEGFEVYNAESKLQRSECAEFSLVPTYESLAQHDSIYALNISANEWDGSYGEYPAGSAFVKNLRGIQPFQAYLISKASAAKAPMLYSIGGGDGTITGIDSPILTPDQATKAYSKDGVLYIHSNKERTIYIYDVTGRTVRILEAVEGENQISGLEKGIYFLEGQKVAVQ